MRHLYLHALPTALAVSIALICAAAFAQDARWRELGDGMRWDTKTATRSENIFYVWFEGPSSEEQRRTLRKQIGDLANEISTQRYKVGINCLERRMAFLVITFLNEKSVPVVPSNTFPQDHVTWQSIAPETNGEAVLEDVCATMKK
jgi:hypothetical protein